MLLGGRRGRACDRGATAGKTTASWQTLIRVRTQATPTQCQRRYAAPVMVRLPYTPHTPLSEAA